MKQKVHLKCEKSAAPSESALFSWDKHLVYFKRQSAVKIVIGSLTYIAA